MGAEQLSTTTGKKRMLSLVDQLVQERNSFVPTWKECAEYILPTRARFFVDDVNKGSRKNESILDSTATTSANVCSSGIMSGVTSPARVWFKFAVKNQQLQANYRVKRWLSDCAQIISDTFLRSNLYKVLPLCYKDLSVFGTSPVYVESDTNKVMKFKSFPIGSYMIAQDADGTVNTFARQFKYTVQQVVDKWATKENGKVVSFNGISKTVASMYMNGQTQEWIEIVHVIKPNDEYDREKKDFNSRYKKFYSCYFESGNQQKQISQDVANENVFLSESGYDYFPILCPRWSLTGEDVYANSCPGIDSLGDIKQLQMMELRILEAVDKIVNPPTIGPTNVKGKGPGGKLMPGEHITAESRNNDQAVRAAYQINFSVREAEEKQMKTRYRIEENFFKPLFLAFAQADRKSGTTAAEIYEIKDEKLLALGPSYEQLNQDLLDPLIDIAFYEHLEQGLLPPPPPELQGQTLKVEYISQMSQAQKMVGISAIERTSAYIGQMAQFDQNALDKFNVDVAIDLYAESTGVNPSLIRGADEVAILRQQKLQAAQAAQNMTMLQKGSEAAKNLSESYTDGDNALTRLLNTVRS